MPMLETVEFLKSGNIHVGEFDALICSSGSEVYYPGSYAEEDRKLGSSWLLHPIEEDVKSNNAYCVSYSIKDPSKAKRVDDMRQKLRMRGLRCHLMYCRNSTRMQIIPLLASRAQALRYLFVRWRLNLTNMYVILGETGDTNYEELISGAHKTLIMKGVVEKGSEELLRTSGSYLKADIVPGESPLIVYTSGDQVPVDEIASAIKDVSKSASGM